MSIPSEPLPVVGGDDSIEEPKIPAALAELQSILTGGIDITNLAAALNSLIGLTDSGAIRRGATNTTPEETVSAPSYAYMPTPDRVPNVTCATNSLLLVSYRATWRSTVAGAGRAGIFVGATQLKVPSFSGAGFGPVASEAATPAGVNHAPLATYPGGLVCDTGATAVDYPGDTVASAPLAVAAFAGTFLGGLCVIEPPVGTFDVGVKFNATSGASVLVKNRRLRVWVLGF